VKGQVFNRLLYRHWTAYTHDKRTHLFSVDVKGATPKDLTPGDHDVPPFNLGGQDFYAISPDGKEIANEDELKRIRSLAVPPAYTDIWICPLANGHLQATGRDKRGRKQYRYHKRFREIRDETKYGRMIAFAQALPQIRKRIEHDLALPGLPRRSLSSGILPRVDEREPYELA